ncbi:MAG TPA: HAMP domain-containing sensor histidine kinase [Candidatus Obscuribacterales bacterium]
MLSAPKTIYAKGFVLISVPLLVELLFGVTMLSLQYYDDAKLNRERTALEIVYHANEMWINCAEAMMLMGYARLFGGSESPVHSRVAHLNHEYTLLTRLVAHNPQQIRELKNIRQSTNRVLQLIQRFRPLLSAERSTSEKIAVLTADIDTFVAAYNLINPMSFAIGNFAKPEFLHSPAAMKEVERTTTLVDSVVGGTLAVSTLVAIALFVYFIRTINNGLAVMVDNTQRFRRGEALTPRLGGVDELSRVDAAFHDMADEIRDTQGTREALMAMISHDLRTPLGSVLGYFSLLASGGLGHPSSEAISGAEQREREIEQLMHLINNLLDLERLDAGKLDIQPASAPLSTVIEDARDKMNSLAESKKIEIAVDAASVQIYADHDRMVQALANLLSGVVSLSPEGSTVNISAAPSGDRVEVRINCSAATLSTDQLNALFDRYQQTDIGLRLQMCVGKELIRLHNGTVEAACEQPHGLTLLLGLPSSAEPGT